MVSGSPFLLTDQQQVGEEQEDEGLFAHFLAKSQLISVVFPADPGALGLLDQVPGRGHQVDPGDQPAVHGYYPGQYYHQLSLEVQAGVDLDKLLLPLPVPGPLVAPADKPVEGLQTLLELPRLIGVSDDGGHEEGQPRDPLHGQHEEGVERKRLAGLQ